MLRPPRVAAVGFDEYRDASRFNGEVVQFLKPDAFIGFRDIDLTGVRSIRFRLSVLRNPGELELRSGGPEGTVIGRVRVPPTYMERAVGSTVAEQRWRDFTVPLGDVTGVHDLYIVVRGGSEGAGVSGFEMDAMTFER